MVEVRVLDLFIVLESADHNTRSDALLVGKGDDNWGGKHWITAEEGIVCRLRNQCLRCERICLAFPLALLVVLGQPLYEDVPAPVPQNMAEFVKQSEPEDVCPFPAKTQLDENLFRGDSTSSRHGRVSLGGGGVELAPLHRKLTRA